MQAGVRDFTDSSHAPEATSRPTYLRLSNLFKDKAHGFSRQGRFAHTTRFVEQTVQSQRLKRWQQQVIVGSEKPVMGINAQQSRVTSAHPASLIIFRASKLAAHMRDARRSVETRL